MLMNPYAGKVLERQLYIKEPVLLPEHKLSAKIDGALPFAASLLRDYFVTPVCSLQSASPGVCLPNYKRGVLHSDNI